MGTASSILPLPPAPAHYQEHHAKAKHSQQLLLHQIQDNSLTNQLEHSEGEIFAPSASRPSFLQRSLLMLKRPEKITKTITVIDPGALCVPYVRRYPFLDFRFEKKVGQSRSCTVHRAVPLREVYAEQVAIKETKVEHRTTQCEDLWYELNILSQLSHPNLMQLHAIYEPYDSHGKCYIVLEYLRGGELVPNLIARKKFSFLDILSFFQQVAAALAYLHGLGIVFGNLLPENIVFLDKFDPNDRLANVVKLVGFERMEFLAAGHRRPLPRGHDDDPSLFFPQPEPQRAATSLEGDELSAAASAFFHFDDRRRLLQLRQADDVWQFGELFYFLLAGRFSREVKPFAHRADTIGFHGAVWQSLGPPAKSFFLRALHFSPLQRATAQELLGDGWFSTDLAASPCGLTDVDLSENLPALVRFHVERLRFFSQWVVTKKLEFSKVGRFQDEHVLAAF